MVCVVSKVVFAIEAHDYIPICFAFTLSLLVVKGVFESDVCIAVDAIPNSKDFICDAESIYSEGEMKAGSFFVSVLGLRSITARPTFIKFQPTV